jgi:dTDP-4-dehydrorhamnose reductase
VAITGASGQLGRQLDGVYRSRGNDVLRLSRPEFRLEDPETHGGLRTWRPDVIINAAAWTDVDGCALDPRLANQLNGRAPGHLAELARRIGAIMVQISTNEVFDGAENRSYREGDEPSPINPYGASKALGERLVAGAGGPYLIIRTAWLFGPGAPNFVTRILAAADRAKASGEPIRVVNNEWGNPTSAIWLADAIARRVDAIPEDRTAVSRAGWAAAIVRNLPVDLAEVQAADFPRSSRVPLHAVLESERSDDQRFAGWELPTSQLVAELLAEGRTATDDSQS